MKRFIVTLTVITAAVMELIDTSIVNVALTQMSGNLGATIEDIAWVVTGYAIANVIIIPMTGFLQNYFGRKNYYLASIVLFTIASWLCAESTSLWELVFFRFMQGIGGGALLSTSQGILFDEWPLEKRGMASGLFGMGIIVGPTIGPTLGGFIVDHYSWPLIFTINIPVGIIAFLLTWFFVDRQPYEFTIDRSVMKIDYMGIILLVMGIGALQTVLEKGESEDWFQTAYIGWLTLAAVVGIVGFVVWELYIEKPLVNLRVMKNRNFTASTILTFAGGYGLFAAVFVFPVLSQRVLGYTPFEAGIELLPGALCAVLILPIVGRRLSAGTPPSFFIVPGFLFNILFCVMMYYSSPDSGQASFFIPLLFRGIGTALLIIPLVQQSVADLPPAQLPYGIALTNMFRQLGGAFGIAVTNTFIATRVGEHRVALISNIEAGNPATEERLANLIATFQTQFATVADATAAAYRQLDAGIMRQAYLQSYLDSFLLTASFFALTLPLIFLTKTKKKDPALAKAVAEAAH